MTEVATNRELIFEAMARLTPAQRDVIRRSYYEARTPAQIADELRIDEDTVKSRLHFGVRALLRSLEEHASTRIGVHRGAQMQTMSRGMRFAPPAGIEPAT
jgi:RNA polymerase sigma-70 factor (ECF subfamily)